VQPREFFDSDGLRLIVEQSLASYLIGHSNAAPPSTTDATDATEAEAAALQKRRTQADEARRVAYREALRDAAAPLLAADPRLRGGADEAKLLDIFECADLDLSGELEPAEFGLALRLVQRAWPDDEKASGGGGGGGGAAGGGGGSALVSGSGMGVDGVSKGREDADALRFAQMDADGDGAIGFAEVVRYRQRQLDLAQRMQRGFRL